MQSVPTRIYLETGKTWTFAAAVEWPGWCRRGKGEEAAIEELLAYADRYAKVVGTAPDQELDVVGRVKGTATTDFGAPDVRGPWDNEPLSTHEVTALQKCWEYCDLVVARVSPKLQKGPKGGGRDRDPMVEHVMNAERAYGRKIGARVPPRTPWPDQRQAILDALEEPVEAWPARYAIRRMAWHVLDHAWEMEDKDLSADASPVARRKRLAPPAR